MITGAQVAKITGKTMIKKNEIYFYEFYCLDNNKYMTEIVLALQDEFTNKDEYLSSHIINELTLDIVDVLFRDTVKTVLITELYEIGA